MKPEFDYPTLLQKSYEFEKANGDYSYLTRLQFLAGEVFNIATYDSELDDLFALKAVEVCEAISGGTTFDYIKPQGDYIWYLQMCHIPFFADHIEWGTSIRGAWWRHDLHLLKTGAFYFEENTSPFDTLVEGDDWREFIDAVITFSKLP